MALEVSLTAAARANLQSLTSTKTALSTAEQQLATGKSVNNASDNAVSYFASQGFLNRANDLSSLKNSLATSLQTVTSTTQSITDINTTVQQLQGIVTSALGTTDTTTRLTYASQFNALLTQLDQLVNDATFNGTNLLSSTGTTLVVYFNETNTTALTVTGVNVTSAGLGIAAATNGFSGTSDINTSSSLLLTAINTLRGDASAFGGNATLIQTRQDFTTNLINSLQTASDNLVLADTNQAGAELTALQTQNQLGIISLSISGQISQGVLRLFS